MIESKNDTSKNLEKSMQALKQAQQRVANEKNFPDCYSYDEGKFHLQWTMPASWHMRRALSVLRQPKGEKVSKLPYAIPLRKLRLLPLNEAMLHFVNICVQTKAKVRLLSAHKVYECAPLLYRQNVGVAYG